MSSFLSGQVLFWLIFVFCVGTGFFFGYSRDRGMLKAIVGIALLLAAWYAQSFVGFFAAALVVWSITLAGSVLLGFAVDRRMNGFRPQAHVELDMADAD